MIPVSILPAVLAELQPTPTAYGASRWTEYQRCQMAHHLRYVVQLRTKPLPPTDLEELPEHNQNYFAIGQLVHAAKAFIRRGVMLEDFDRDWRWVLEAATVQSDSHRAYHLDDIAEADRLLNAYWCRWGTRNGGFADGVQILAVEELLEDQIGPLPYTARADAIIEAAGEIIVPDTKTRAQKLSDDRARAAEGYATRPQFLGLSWLVQRKFKLESPPSIWIDAIIKTKIPKLDRLMVPIAQVAVDRWLKQQSALALDLDLATRFSEPPQPNYAQCAPDMGSRCSYFQWCHGPDAAREKYFQKGSE